MEWIKVLYPQKRDVFVDGRRSGETGVKLIVARGRHRFDLGAPHDYSPGHRDVSVTGTSPLSPMLIEFGRGAKRRSGT